jgi:hypothetical protein
MIWLIQLIGLIGQIRQIIRQIIRQVLQGWQIRFSPANFGQLWSGPAKSGQFQLVPVSSGQIGPAPTCPLLPPALQSCRLISYGSARSPQPVRSS